MAGPPLRSRIAPRGSLDRIAAPLLASPRAPRLVRRGSCGPAAGAGRRRRLRGAASRSSRPHSPPRRCLPSSAAEIGVRGKLKRDLRGGLKRDPPGRGRGRSPRSSLPPSKKIEESESLPGGRSERRAAARWVRPSGRAGSKSHFATVSTRYGGRGAGAKLGLTSDRRPAHDDVRAPRRNCVTLRTTRESSSARAAWRA
jgi:hypothetical protein